MADKSLINKYQPLYFKDFGENNITDILKTLIDIDTLNVLLIGETTCGKTSILNAIIREYYSGFSPTDYK